MEYINLDVWKETGIHTNLLYDSTKSYPSDEIFGLVSQMRRSTVSILSNIAEGCGRDTSKETVHFLFIARGSLYALETQLYISLDQKYLNEEQFTLHQNQLRLCKKILNGFINYYRNKTKMTHNIPSTGNPQQSTKILVLDNYDSFTYNLVQMIEQIIGEKVNVFRNDQISLEDIEKYDKIILSPGPGIPQEAGILLDVIKKYAPTKSILGVCLGQQAIAEAFGGSLINLSEIYHGVATESTQIKEHKLFNSLPEKLEVGRYHSWAVNPEDFPEELEITSIDKNGMIMSLKHKTYDVHAVQYHPESILTPNGKQILENFLK